MDLEEGEEEVQRRNSDLMLLEEGAPQQPDIFPEPVANLLAKATSLQKAFEQTTLANNKRINELSSRKADLEVKRDRLQLDIYGLSEQISAREAQIAPKVKYFSEGQQAVVISALDSLLPIFKSGQDGLSSKLEVVQAELLFQLNFVTPDNLQQKLTTLNEKLTQKITMEPPPALPPSLFSLSECIPQDPTFSKTSCYFAFDLRGKLHEIFDRTLSLGVDKIDDYMLCPYHFSLLERSLTEFDIVSWWEETNGIRHATICRGYQ